MAAALLWSVAAFVLVVLLGALLAVAFRGADIARARQTQRYRVLELKSEEKAIHIRTDRLLWQAAQDAARAEQKDRHTARRREINAWHREFQDLQQRQLTRRPGIPGVRWPE